jgi:geranylgeranylglycerol-phosphate geranylgeranyltransferase
VLTRKLYGMIRLFRPELPTAAGLCVVTGQILASGGLPDLRTGILGFVCVFCLSGAALILNDYFDYEVDKINSPQRALPSGQVTRAEAIGLAIVTTLIGFVCAFALGMDALIVSVLIWVVGFLYNWRYKQSGLPGNLMVSTSVAGTFIFGAISMHAPWNIVVWTFSMMAFFIDLGEEIAGDAFDMEGDKVLGSRSLALLKGKRFALRTSVVLWSLVILLSLMPVVLGLLGWDYLAMILITDVLIVVFSVRILTVKNEKAGRWAMRGIYMGATVGIIAFLVGQLLA